MSAPDTCDQSIHSGIRKRITSEMETHPTALSGGAVARCEVDLFGRGDGRQYWLRWDVCPWRDFSGNIRGLNVAAVLKRHPEFNTPANCNTEKKS